MPGGYRERSRLFRISSALSVRDSLHLCRDSTDDVLNQMVVEDETWVHHGEPETKQESGPWREEGMPPPKKLQVSQGAGDIMATVLWGRRVAC